MQFRIVHLFLATSLVAFFSMPAGAQVRNEPADLRAGVPQLQFATLLPDERDQPLRLLALIGPAAAISALTILGLTITFRALRQDMRQRRVVYRQRNR